MNTYYSAPFLAIQIFAATWAECQLLSLKSNLAGATKKIIFFKP
jgi:hypothetical protein